LHENRNPGASLVLITAAVSGYGCFAKRMQLIDDRDLVLIGLLF